MADRGGEASSGVTSATLSIPNAYPAWNAIIADDAPVVSIEHSIVRTRIDQGVLLQCVIDAINGPGYRDIVWCGPDYRIHRRRFQKWMRRNSWDLQGTEIHFVAPKDVERLPLETIHRLVLSHASEIHEVVATMLLRLTVGRTTVLGTIAPRDHWFYSFARNGSTHHVLPGDVVPYNDVDCDAWRDKLTDDSFRRLVQCEDVDAPDALRLTLPEFAEQRLVIRNKESVLQPFTLNDPQRDYLRQKADAIAAGMKPRFLVLKSRRRGLSTLEQADSYQRTAELPYHQCVTLAHTDQATRRIFKISKLFHDKDGQAPPIVGVGNSTKIEFRDNGSEFFIGTAGSKGFGRGDTLNKVHGSEVAFWCPGPHKVEQVETLIAGLLEACSHGEVVLETTPNGMEWFATTWKDARAGKNDWVCIFLPWFTDPDNRLETGTFDADEIIATLRKDEKALVRKHNLTTNQLAWRRAKKRELGYLFDQEYPEDETTCFLVTGVMYFDKECILEALEDVDAPEEEHVPGGKIYYFERPRKDVEYVAGSDTSEGLPTSDDNGTVIRRRDTGAIAARVYGLFSINQQAELGARLVKEYGVKMWGIERENHGHAVILAVTGLGFRGMSERGILYEHKKGKVGWSTNAETRPQMLHSLRTFVEDRPELNADALLLGQCLTFKKQRSGKFEHDPGANDDAVIMDAICIEMRNHRVKRPRLTVG